MKASWEGQSVLTCEPVVTFKRNYCRGEESCVISVEGIIKHDKIGSRTLTDRSADKSKSDGVASVSLLIS